MTMTDREMLELAAKAAGMPFHKWNDAHGYLMVNVGGDTREWNPLTDDGDALRLAVKLGLSVSMPSDKYPSAFAQEWHGQGPCARAVPAENDPYAATRRAIVGTAAYIGKAMPCKPHRKEHHD